MNYRHVGQFFTSLFRPLFSKVISNMVEVWVADGYVASVTTLCFICQWHWRLKNKQGFLYADMVGAKFSCSIVI